MFKIRWLLFILVLGLLACNEAYVAEDLTLRQANDVVAVLQSNGISAMAENAGSGTRSRYRVYVTSGFYGEAVRLLSAKDLPKPPKMGFDELTAQRGLLPNSRELEALRLDHALSVELVDLLNNLPKVASVDAIVRKHSIQGSAEPTVTLVIEEKPGQYVGKDEVLNIVESTVPGIARDNILVTTSQPVSAEVRVEHMGLTSGAGDSILVPLTQFLYVFRVPEGDRRGLATVIVASILLAGLLALIVGYWWGRYRQVENSTRQSLPEMRFRSSVIERGISEFKE